MSTHAHRASAPAPTNDPTPLPIDAPRAPRPWWFALAPLCLMVFAEFLAMGLPLPVLPGRVHDALGFGTFLVGVVVGAQSWVTLLTRHAAGTRTDQRGPRRTAMRGLVLSSVAGVLSAVSTTIPDPTTSLLALLAGRGLLGLGESLVVTSALAWGVALAGPARSGRVMAWVGIAMYAALAVGAPIGAALEARLGIVGTFVVAAFAPLAGLAGAVAGRAVAPVGGTRLPFHRVARMILLPGAGLFLGAVGFGAIAAFATLLFRERGWSHASLAMTAFGAAYVVARLAFGSLPDRHGGARVGAAAALLVTVGQVAMFLASTSVVAIVAASVTGFGFSLAFPAFGVEAIRRVPAQNRGVALGAYAACFDASMGLAVPALGLVAGRFGAQGAFAVGALASVAALVVAVVLIVRAPSSTRRPVVGVR